MDELKALHLMKEQLNKADSLTATLYGYGISAIEEKQNKKTIREQQEELCKRVCDEICKHQEKTNGIEAYYNMINNVCPNCPLYELTR